MPSMLHVLAGIDRQAHSQAHQQISTKRKKTPQQKQPAPNMPTVPSKGRGRQC